MKKLIAIFLFFFGTSFIYAQKPSKVRPEGAPSVEELRRQKDLEAFLEQANRLDKIKRDNNISYPTLVRFATDEKEVVQKIIKKNQDLINKIKSINGLESLSKEVNKRANLLDKNSNISKDEISRILEIANENIRRGNARLLELEKKVTNNKEVNITYDLLKNNSSTMSWSEIYFYTETNKNEKQGNQNAVDSQVCLYGGWTVTLNGKTIKVILNSNGIYEYHLGCNWYGEFQGYSICTGKWLQIGDEVKLEEGLYNQELTNNKDVDIVCGLDNITKKPRLRISPKTLTYLKNENVLLFNESEDIKLKRFSQNCK